MQIKLHAKGELFKQQLSVLFLFSRSEQRMRLCKIALFFVITCWQSAISYVL
uniref:Uncharacterized protein n=1 Tax=Erwinia amylovora ATCC BAA-2158 TaxID=889211 RepID=E5B7R3_ERWAM|nr:hypothetical protein predicted by Glimmer/Critica [Erwinia amylovora ATCC BAA-2158]